MTTFALITDTEVAAALGLGAPDAQATRITTAVNNWAKRMTGRAFQRQAQTLVSIIGYGLDYIFLPEAPIFAVTEVRVDSTGVLDATTALTDLTKIYWNAYDTSGREDFRLWRRDGYFPEATFPTVAVSFDAGYYATGDATTGHDIQVPDELRDALIAEACDRYRKAGNERVKDLHVGAYSMAQFDTGVDPEIRAVVRRYRRPI